MELSWTSEEVKVLTNGQSNHDWVATGVSIDSRTLRSGDLFIPLVGPNFDGHDYIEYALKSGAVASISSQEVIGKLVSAPLITVSETYEALHNLGKGGRNRSSAKVIAVTGSVGKTSVKEALGELLSEQGATSYSEGSYNNRFGVPLSLARLPENTDYGIFEIGMNQPGELSALAKLVRPHVAVVTAIEIAHIEFFSSIDQIAVAKSEIFDGLEKGGTAILNKDSRFFDVLQTAALEAGAEQIIGFGSHKDARFKLLNFDLLPDGSKVEVCVDDSCFDYYIPMPGRHWVQNSLAILAAIKAIGADVLFAAKNFSKIQPVKGRGQQFSVPVNDGFLHIIDDSYNASPASLAAAVNVLEHLSPKKNGRRICVLGDMKELGEKSTELHFALAEQLGTSKVAHVYTIGPEMRGMSDRLPARMQIFSADETDDVIEPLLNSVRAGDIVLVKGSASFRMHKVVRALSNLKIKSNKGDDLDVI